MCKQLIRNKYIRTEILNQLKEEHVVGFEIVNNKKLLKITEYCDECYFIRLDKEEALNFVEELTELINQMEE